MVRIIRSLLTQRGFENVGDVSNGSAALAKMQTRQHGLVISDFDMGASQPPGTRAWPS